MIKKVLLTLLLVPSLALAQNRTTATANLMGLGMPGQLAQEVAELATGDAVISNNTPIKFANASGASVSVLNLNASNQLQISPGTTDAADNANLQLGGGGGFGSTRGAGAFFYGNEDPGSNDGKVLIYGGNVSSGDVQLQVTNASARIRFQDTAGNTAWSITDAGLLNANATDGGDIVFSGSGQTLSIQEATATTACMGVATPNGNTPVAITTSCATTGARVFYSRVGAVTNMGTITTTTAPSGTGFSFASTGASDTLASSVIYLIVKESS